MPRLRGQEDDPVTIDGVVRLAGYKLKNKTEHSLELDKGEAIKLKPLAAGGGKPWDDPRLRLSAIIQKMNEIFAGKHTDSEFEGWFTSVVGNASANAALVEQANANPNPAQFANGDYRSVLAQSVIQALKSHHSMSEQILEDTKVFEEIADLLLPEIYQMAKLAGKQDGAPL